MNIRLIDSTLREGLQSPHSPIFQNDKYMREYVEDTSELGLVDRFEIYMPGVHISHDVWGDIVSTHREQIQVYVGPANSFDINERNELRGGEWPILSTTLVRKSDRDIKKLADISSDTNNSPLRVGIECAGELSPSRTLNLIKNLGSVPTVEIVSINDSNSRMSKAWIDKFAQELKDNEEKIPKLGFHLHNSGGTALSKAQLIVDKLTNADIPELEFDVTALGLGERLGILSVADVVTHMPSLEGKIHLLDQYTAIVNRYITKRKLPKRSLKDTAISHYDENGKLRPEYS